MHRGALHVVYWFEMQNKYASIEYEEASIYYVIDFTEWFYWIRYWFIRWDEDPSSAKKYISEYVFFHSKLFQKKYRCREKSDFHWAIFYIFYSSKELHKNGEIDCIRPFDDINENMYSIFFYHELVELSFQFNFPFIVNFIALDKWYLTQLSAENLQYLKRMTIACLLQVQISEAHKRSSNA